MGQRQVTRAAVSERKRSTMANIEQYENLVRGSGVAGRLMTWTLANVGHRTAIVERGPFGGACPTVACLPSKNVIHSAKVAAFARRGAEFGIQEVLFRSEDSSLKTLDVHSFGNSVDWHGKCFYLNRSIDFTQ